MHEGAVTGKRPLWRWALARLWHGPDRAAGASAPAWSGGIGGLEPAEDARVARRIGRFIGLVGLFVGAFVVWAYWAELAEVSSGQATVVPSRGTQVIQSLEGGILQELLVAEGEMVEPGQPLARLDPTRTQADMDEVIARYQGALARKARLEAELAGEGEIRFPEELDLASEVVAAERTLFEARRAHLERTEQDIRTSLQLVGNERSITEELVRAGAASEVELLQLRRSEADLRRELNQLRNEFRVRARQDLAETRTEVEALRSSLRGHEDTRQRQTLRSPVRGRVQNLAVTTIGGVLAPNGELMEIVPQDGELRIEARISPRDIAYIHPGQRAQVKITAYDYAIYGGLEGEVVNISPDTERDEINPEEVYYKVFIHTDSDELVVENGQRFPISPGMVAEVDIETGQRTVLQYIIKPFNRAREALRER
ncbi:HlyD family type I secretion periplasmic adaptor subunit [Alkalilimnicola ehrlichii MLHE-1]|uniref:Membrane fusion protein (MFP) family protein n=1 Tax=Alkalilimnicola ehrlichii (strain ATCC BAA-1101 / DSM 17681 / MLHE-1) TaxID=187272 RepID=Q0A6M9_ALKEH|nr:HlyD family type I secretion periplasmic adaptor subunit [Alkalilimnicola ehrlichii]ABI57508.1 type I secretion membrane fusion protein, HlyD family [Alkalilimnicola ehrlichii MLHE-1]